MSLRTIKELNSKKLYRLIKVTYILFFLIVLISYNVFVFTEIGVKNLDLSKTIIKCNVKDKKTFTAKNLNLNFYGGFNYGQFNYEQFFNNSYSWEIEKIMKACNEKLDLDNYDIYDAQKASEISNKYGLIGKEKTVEELELLTKDFKAYKEQTKFVSGSSEAKYLDFNFNLFDIEPIFNYNEFIKYFTFWNLIIMFSFEFFRRAFYYIYFGKIKPEKDKLIK